MKIKKSQLREAIKDIIREETQYQIFFKKALNKFGVSSPDEFESEEKKKEFFDYVDSNWKADDEPTEGYNENTEYQAFFRKAMKKFGVNEPDELEGEEKKKFFNYVDKHWQAKDERKESIRQTQLAEGKLHIVPSDKGKSMPVGKQLQVASDFFSTIDRSPKVNLTHRDDGVFKVGDDVRIEFNVKSSSEANLIKKLLKHYDEFQLRESVNEDEDPCWDDYEMVGMKTKNGKEVPNCVPKNEVNEVSTKGMKKIKVDGLGGYMPGVKHVFYDNQSDTFYFDQDGDVEELKNKSTLTALGKYLKKKNIRLEGVNESNHGSTLKFDVARQLKVNPNSLSVGVGFSPKRTSDGNFIIVIGLDTKVKKISIPQADYFGDEVSHGGYLIVKADKNSGKLIKVLGRVDDKNKIKLSDFVNEASDYGIKFGKDGHVKHIKGLNGKLQKSVKVDGKEYRYNSTYKTYNSVKGNELLHKNDVDKARTLQRERKDDFAGWVAIYKGKRLEIDKSEASGIYGAKQIAIKKLKVPKSKQGLLAIAPAVSESVNEAKYNTKADIVNGYIKGEIDMKELKKYADAMGTGIATKRELESIINNGFMRGMMADTHGVSEKDIVKKVKDLLKNKMYEGLNEKIEDFYRGDLVHIPSKNKSGVVMKQYGRKVLVKCSDGSEKTYTHDELRKIQSDGYKKRKKKS